jgi:hypothetical protein
MIAMLHIETFFSEGDAFDSVGFHEEVGLEMLYPSQWMIQASLVMAWPSMLEGWLDGGLVKVRIARFPNPAERLPPLFD